MLRFLVHSFAGALVICASAHAQSIPVTVVNTAARPVPTTITNTPAVTVSNAVQVSGPVQVTGSVSVDSPVRVRYQPAGGSPFVDFLPIAAAFPGSVSGDPGPTVPAGKRRIITTISGNWQCTTGHTAMLQVSTNIAQPGGGGKGLTFYLPGQLVMKDYFGQDVYAMFGSTNLIMAAGQYSWPTITGDGAVCSGSIFLSGVEVPDEP